MTATIDFTGKSGEFRIEGVVIGGDENVDDLKISVHLYRQGEVVGILRLSRETYEDLFLSITNLLATHIKYIENGR